MTILNIEIGDTPREHAYQMCKILKEAINHFGIRDVLICPMRYGIGQVFSDDQSVLCIDIHDTSWLNTDDAILGAIIKDTIKEHIDNGVNNL